MKALFVRLTAPPSSVIDLDIRRKIRLFRGMMIILTFASWYTIPFYWLTTPPLPLVDYIPDATAVILIPTLYFISGRWRRYQVLVWMMLIFTYLATFAISIPDPGMGYESGLLVYLVLNIIIAGALIGEAAALFFIIANMVGVFIFAAALPNVNLIDTDEGFVTIAGLLIVAVLYYQRVIFGAQQAQIQQSEQRYRALVDFSPEPVLVHTGDTLLFANLAALELFGMSQLTSEKPLTEIYETEPEPLFRQNAFSTVYRTEEYDFRLPNGESIPVEYTHIKIDYGTISAYQLILHDIRERKASEANRIELEIERQHTNRLREFFSDISHDLRTPLTGISTTVYILRRKLSNNTDIAPQITRLEILSKRLNSVVEDSLALVWADSLRPAEFQHLALSDFLRQLCEEFKATAQEKSITLTCDIPPDLPALQVAEAEFQRIFDNLLGNALRYTPAEGTIGLRAWADSNLVWVEISDTGIGIAKDDLPNIFDRFYRADAARHLNGEGTGLGLAIVKKIVALHGGDITVESTEGEGTRFRLSFSYEDSTRVGQ